MDQTNPKISLAGEFQEFINYDAKGNPVVLRSNVTGAKLDSPDLEEPSISSVEASPEGAFSGMGSLRFFCDAKSLSAKLKKPVKD